MTETAATIMRMQNPSRVMRALPDIRYVEMAPGVRVLEQAWAPADGSGGTIEWRRVPVVSREEAGYE